MTTVPVSGRRWIRRPPQFGDQPQNLGEQHSWHRDLGHLESNIAAVVDDLRTDLDQLFLEAGQRPRLCCFRHRQRPHEVPEVIGQRMELKTLGVGGEGST